MIFIDLYSENVQFLYSFSYLFDIPYHKLEGLKEHSHAYFFK
jgi:hypothetical protein